MSFSSEDSLCVRSRTRSACSNEVSREAVSMHELGTSRTKKEAHSLRILGRYSDRVGEGHNGGIRRNSDDRGSDH